MLQEPFNSLSGTIPASVGGWNRKDPLDLMPETDAVELDNWFPSTGDIRLRNGFSNFCVSGMGTDHVHTLLEIVGASGTEKFISCGNNKIYNITSGTAADITGSTTPTSDKWQYVVYKNVAILVNGQDQPQQISATPTVTDATYTGIPDDAKLIGVTVYRSAIYFIDKDNLSIWYGATNTLTGALTEFDLERIASRGGYLQFISTWTRESGSGTDDLLVIGTNQGEVFVYAGANPGDASWNLQGVYYIPKPLGRRCTFKLGPDLIILTEQGPIPMSAVLNSSGGSGYNYATISDKIQPAFVDAARAAGTSFGWEGIVYPQGNFALVNVPISEGIRADQYVLNTLTGAWCRFRNQLAHTWCLFQGNLYFGSTGGKVYLADDGTTDNGANITASCKQSFSYLGDRTREKRVVLARPLMQASAGLTLNYDVASDFDTRTLTNTLTVESGEGSSWDVDDWDVASWADDEVPVMDWVGTAAIGRAIGIQMGGSFSNVLVRVTAHQIIYETGGYI